MARTAVTPTELVRDAGVDTDAVATTIDATLVTNGLSLTGAGGHRGRVVLTVANSAATPLDVTVAGGPQGGGDGDLVVAVAAGGTQSVVLGDTARHQQSDGAVHVDFEAGFTGTITALAVPH